MVWLYAVVLIPTIGAAILLVVLLRRQALERRALRDEITSSGKSAEQLRCERLAERAGMSIDEWFEDQAEYQRIPLDQFKRRAGVGNWRDSLATPPTGTAVATYGSPQLQQGLLVLEADQPRLATIAGSFPVTADVRASVETAGAISATSTRGRNLAAKAAGTALLGPIGLLTLGNAKVSTEYHDGRELYVLVEGPDWYIVYPSPPDWGAEARAFAQEVNLLARAQPAREATNGELVIDQLERLTRLRERGALTDDEFNAQKQALLDL